MSSNCIVSHFLIIINDSERPIYYILCFLYSFCVKSSRLLASARAS